MGQLKVLCLIFLLVGCNLGQEQLPDLSLSQGVPFGVEDFPEGWYFTDVKTTGHEGWGKAKYYVTTFSTRSPDHLGASLFFVKYRDVDAAKEAFKRLESGVFYSYMRPADYWTIPSELNSNIQFAVRYRLGCSRWGDRYPDRDICEFFAQYESCLIQFSSPVQGSFMTYADFVDIVENAIDARMVDVSICYSNQ